MTEGRKKVNATPSTDPDPHDNELNAVGSRCNYGHIPRHFPHAHANDGPRPGGPQVSEVGETVSCGGFSG